MERMNLSVAEKTAMVTNIVLPLLKVYEGLNKQIDSYEICREYMTKTKVKKAETKGNFFVLGNQLDNSNMEFVKQNNNLRIIIEDLLVGLDVPEVTEILKHNKII